MKKSNTKKLAFKKINVVELNSTELAKIVGGTDTTTTGYATGTDPRSNIYTSAICELVTISRLEGMQGMN